MSRIASRVRTDLNAPSSPQSACSSYSRISGVTTPGQTETFGYSYDGLNRLGAVTTTNAESFTLDAASNITARTGPSATYTIDGENRPTSDGTNTLTWSSADRLTGRGSDTFGYDALDRLTSSTVASVSRSYSYSGDGLLQSRTQGTATSFLWDAATSPSRLLAQGGDRVIYGLGPLYIIKADGTTRALARDGGKSVRAEVSGSGAVTGSWRYRAYGETSQTSAQATPSILGYAGQLLDPSGLYYMRARWYDAVTGRFVSRDAFLGAVATPRSLNAFGYANADPIGLSDPSGTCVPPVTVACAVVAAPYAGAAAAMVWAAVTITFATVGAGVVWLATDKSNASQQPASDGSGTVNPKPPKWEDRDRGPRDAGLEQNPRDQKVHGNLPSASELRTWTRNALEESLEPLRTSIRMRRQGLDDIGWDLVHSKRLGQEENVLRLIESILDELPAGGGMF